MAGRSILDKFKRSEICAVVAMGCSRQVAARYVGCSRSTIYRTALRDPEFRRQLLHAEARYEVFHLGNIGEAARCKQYWRAAAWILERKYPQRYAPRPANVPTAAEISELLGRFAEIVVEEVPANEQQRQIFARLKGLLAEFNRPRDARGRPALPAPETDPDAEVPDDAEDA